MRQLSVEEISNQIQGLRSDIIREVLAELHDTLEQGRGSEDPDTWEAGCVAAVNAIESNYC